MSGPRLALVVVLVACGSSGSPAPVTSAPRPPPPPARPPPSCQLAADHVHTLIEPKDDRAKKVRDVFLARCEEDRWEADVRACITSTKSLNDPQGCKAQLTPAQREALDRDVADAERPVETSNLPATCVAYIEQIERLQTCQQLPQQTRDALKQSLDATSEAWANVPAEARAALEEACKSASDAIVQAVASTCGW